MARLDGSEVPTIVAGLNNVQGRGCSGLPAVATLLNQPISASATPDGTLFIADTQNNRVMARGVDGSMRLVAGSGTPLGAFHGEQQPAWQAGMVAPRGVAVCSDASVVWTDGNTNRVRMLFPNGTTATVAGTGSGGFNADGTRYNNPSIPTGVVCMPGSGTGYGSIIVSEPGTHRVRSMNLSTGIVDTVLGTGTGSNTGDGGQGRVATVQQPWHVALTTVGGHMVLLVGTEGGHVVRAVNMVSGIVTRFAGTGVGGYSGDNGPAVSAQLNAPAGVSAGRTGRVLIAERFGCRVRAVATDGTITTIAGTGAASFSGDGGPATAATLNNPLHAIELDDGDVLIADFTSHRLRRVDGVTGIITTIAGTGRTDWVGDGGPALSASLHTPLHVAPWTGNPGAYLIVEHSQNLVRALMTQDRCNPQAAVAVGCTLTDSRGLIACNITNFHWPPPLFVYLNDHLCTVTTPLFNRTTVTAVCSHAVALPFIVTMASQFPRVRRTIDMPAGTEATGVAVAADGTFPAVWGATLSFVFSSPLAEHVLSAYLSSAPTPQHPTRAICDNVTAWVAPDRSRSVLNCTATMAVSGVPRLELLLRNGGVTQLPIVGAEGGFQTPIATVTTSLILRHSGGDVVTAALARLPPTFGASASDEVLGRVCNGTASTLRCWVGTTPCSSCIWASASPPRVSCTSPPGAALFARLTVEMCGLFNATSDGLPASAAVNTTTRSLASYLTYNPTPAFAGMATAQPQAVRHVGSVNVSLPLTSTAANELMPWLTGVQVAGSACGWVQYHAATTTLLCGDWRSPGSGIFGATDGLATVLVDLTLRQQRVTLETRLPLLAAPVVQSVNPVRVMAGDCVTMLGSWLSTVTAPVVSASASGLPCTVTSSAATSVTCCLPASIPSTLPTFPRLAVSVTTGAGTSQETVWITTLPQPSTALVGWAAPFVGVASSRTATLPIAPAPAVTINAVGEDTVNCALTITVASCPTRPDAANGWPLALATSPTLIGGVTASGAVSALFDASFTLSGFGVSSGAGCAVNASAQCVEGLGRVRTSPPSQAITFAVPDMHIAWGSSLPADAMTPAATLPAQVAFITVGAPVLPTSTLSSSGLFTCTAALVAATAPAPLTQPLSQTVVPGAVSVMTGSTTYMNTSTVSVLFAGGSTGAAALGALHTLHAECTYLPTGQRMRLPPQSVPIAALSLNVLPTVATTVPVLTYTPVSALFAFNTTVPTLQLPAIVTCRWTVASAPATLRLVSTVLHLSAPSINSAYAFTASLEGGDGLGLTAVLACDLWGQTLTSSPVRFNSTVVTAEVVSQPPPFFVPSGPSNVHTLTREVAVRVSHPSNDPVVAATCALTTPTPNVQLVTMDSSVALELSEGKSTNFLGIAAFSLFGIRMEAAADGRQTNVTLRVVCTRSSGTVLPAISLQLTALQVAVTMCRPPVATTATEALVPMWSLAVVTGASLPLSDPATLRPAACASDVALAQATSSPGALAPAMTLPTVRCTLSDGRSADIAGNRSVLLLEGAEQTLAEGAGLITFRNFVVKAGAGRGYLITVTCTMGSLLLPTVATNFAMEVTGCRPGFQSVGILCQACPAGTYTLGGVDFPTCQSCPAKGARCEDGLVKFLPSFYRPPRHMGQPLTTTSELHLCLNPSACVVHPVPSNASMVNMTTHTCAEGYLGPLCGVCDISSGWGKAGLSCDKCMPAAANVVITLLVVLVLLAFLAYNGLSDNGGQRKPAAIVVKITLSYIQVWAPRLGHDERRGRGLFSRARVHTCPPLGRRPSAR